MLSLKLSQAVGLSFEKIKLNGRCFSKGVFSEIVQLYSLPISHRVVRLSIDQFAEAGEK